MLEKAFQAKVIKRLKKEFPECIVMKNDPTYKQGIPDILVLYNHTWAALEVKQKDISSHRPNQDYYVERMKGMSYANFISPQNEDKIFDDLREVFGTAIRMDKKHGL